MLRQETSVCLFFFCDIEIRPVPLWMLAHRYIDLGIGFITAVLSVTIAFGLFNTVLGTVYTQRLMLIFASIVLVLYCPIIALELTASVAVSDFCVGLDSSFLLVAEECVHPPINPHHALCAR